MLFSNVSCKPSLYSPVEQLLQEEVSVYDLKDHEHYKYRPGAQVLRVGGDQVRVVTSQDV